VTPVRSARVLSRISNKDTILGSPVISPPGSVSGKLIQLFEGLSRVEYRTYPKSADSSPAQSIGKLNAVRIGSFMRSINTMDGTVDDVDNNRVVETYEIKHKDAPVIVGMMHR
jgi:hypothetical protein